MGYSYGSNLSTEQVELNTKKITDIENTAISAIRKDMFPTLVNIDIDGMTISDLVLVNNKVVLGTITIG